MMQEHNFILVLSGDLESQLDELFEAGCDDATFSSVDGVSFGEFDREAVDFAGAVLSAIAHVEATEMRVLRIEPDDLATASEIAEQLGRSRESVRLLAAGKRGDGTFPAPVSHAHSRNSLWRISEVLVWADEIAPERRAAAAFVAAANAKLELRDLQRRGLITMTPALDRLEHVA